jgi:hypothetical protein
MKQDENEQNYKKGLTPVVGQNPNGKCQSKSGLTSAMNDIHCATMGYAGLIVLIAAVGIPGCVALFGNARGRHRDALVVCALIPMGVAGFLMVAQIFGFLSDPPSVRRDDLGGYVGRAIILLAIFLVGLVGLIRQVRNKPK